MRASRVLKSHRGGADPRPEPRPGPARPAESRIAAQILDSLRDPENWYEHISEEIELVDDDAVRRVRVQIAENAHTAALDGSLYLVVAQPLKGTIQPVELEKYGSADSARFLSHREHSRITNLLVLFYLAEVTDLCRPHAGDESALFIAATRALARLLDLVRPVPREDTELESLWTGLLDSSGSLIGFPSQRELPEDVSSRVADFLGLCRSLSVSYLKIAEIRDFDKGPRRIDLRYRDDLTLAVPQKRFWGFLRKWFRAPPPKFYAPLPFATLTDHFEVSFRSVNGYYIQSQRVVSRHDDKQEVGVASDPSSLAPWSAKPSGGVTQATVFVGNGSSALVPLALTAELSEIPPGAVGRAWAASGIGTITAVVMVWWSLAHGGVQVPPAAGLVPAFVAVGSAAIDNLMPNRDVLNSPLLPRIALYSQTIAMLTLALWILIRGSASSLNPVPGDSPLVGFYRGLDAIDFYFGAAIVVTVASFFIALTVRSLRSSAIYYRVVSARTYSEYPSPKSSARSER